jgi:tellurite resistance protein TerA
MTNNVIPAGGNKKLENTNFTLSHSLDNSVDVSIYLLQQDGKVVGDEGMVFYGAPHSSCGGVALKQGQITFNLDRIPTNIAKLSIASTVDTGNFSSKQSFSVSGPEFECQYSTTGRAEAALILMELYRHNGTWKARNVDQGFNGGLQPLAEHFGIEVADPAPAPAPAPKVNLSKISLTKESPKVNLEKKAGSIGLIKANLNWTKGSGLLSKGIDLDLGAYIELNNGQKRIVQALGNNFSFAPYLKLLDDDRTGSNSDGEWIHIDGNTIQEVKKITIFTFIYEGAVNWQKANAYVTLHVPGMPPIETQLNESGRNLGFCAIADLNVNSGRVDVTRLNNYYSGHKECDLDMGWGFRWSRGSK